MFPTIFSHPDVSPEDLSALKEELAKLNKLIDDLNNRFDSLYAQLIVFLPKEVGELQDLQNHIDLIMYLRSLQEEKARDRAEAISTKCEEEIKPPKNNKKLKDLFRRIANLAHPDKVKDCELLEALTDIFLKAKEALKAKDVSAMESLYSEVLSLIRGEQPVQQSAEEAQSELDMLRRAVNEKYMTLGQMQNSNLFSALVMATNGRPKTAAEEFIKPSILNNILILSALLRRLRMEILCGKNEILLLEYKPCR